MTPDQTQIPRSATDLVVPGGPRYVPASEVLASLSRAFDLAEGQPMGHAVRACVIGMRLGEEVGLGEEDLAQLYYALLLKDAGCSSNAARVAAIFGSDDQAVKPRLKVVDGDRRVRLAVETWRVSGMSRSVLSRLRHFVGVAREDHLARELVRTRCERGADIARRLGFPGGTVQAIRSLDEHWNGKGHPEGKRGDEIPVLARILNVAQTVEVFWGAYGREATQAMLRDRRGRWFDPALADRVVGWLRDESFWHAVESPEVEHRVAALAPSQFVITVDEDGLDEIAVAFADIIDAKSPYTARHSSQVALYACAIGAQLSFDAEALVRMRRSALLHDIGKLGVSSRILDKNGPLDPEERMAVARHPLHTWEILRRVSGFADFARQAAAHHERLDGTGYPWNLDGAELDVPSRVLAVADVYEALTADRPYRPGMSVEDAFRILQGERGTRLDAASVDALATVVAREAATGVL